MAEENVPTAAERLARLREQCRSFRSKLSPEDQASFDALLREAARFIQAGALDPNLMLSEVLAVSLSLAVARQLEALRVRISDLEEQLKYLESWR
jgi:hypothetical protein